MSSAHVRMFMLSLYGFSSSYLFVLSINARLSRSRISALPTSVWIPHCYLRGQVRRCSACFPTSQNVLPSCYVHFPDSKGLSHARTYDTNHIFSIYRLSHLMQVSVTIWTLLRRVHAELTQQPTQHIRDPFLDHHHLSSFMSLSNPLSQHLTVHPGADVYISRLSLLHFHPFHLSALLSSEFDLIFPADDSRY